MRKFFTSRVLVVLALIGLVFLLYFFGSQTKKPALLAHLEKSLPSVIDYNLHVRPILSDKCFLCHGPDKNNGQKAGLDLSTRSGATAKLSSGRRAVVPGSLGNSELFHRITTTEDDLVMPSKASNRSLTDLEKTILTKWIEQGAEYKPHWAFMAPEKKELPKVKNTEWPRNPIDYFILKRLEETGLKPAVQASKETLIRRVTLDLTGLPPTVEEIDAFLADQSSDAYEKLVDNLLASPHYGEKMAVDWLDLARYADTHGYTVDRYRMMWPWRDWVIKAFNHNMPFDQFATWQLAGDLLPNASREQKIATAFNRNHAQNMEGGIIDEEFRNEYVVDRTSTVGTAFLGLTIGCAKCHDHKFDPVSQKDFYSLYSFFNNVDEPGQISFDNTIPGPTVLYSTPEQDSLLADFLKQESVKESELQTIQKEEETKFNEWKSKLGNKNPFDLEKGLQSYFDFDKLVDSKFVDRMSKQRKGEVADPLLVPGKSGNAFKSNGDDILKLGKLGIYNRFQPFSIGIWVNIPAEINKGVIFHKGSGDITYGFRGYHLFLRDGKAAMQMAHVWPYNNILKVSTTGLPRNKWIHLVWTYNGNSKANGLKLFMNGKELEMKTEKDNLFKDILFAEGDQPGLQIGADWRATGFKNGLVDELKVYDRELTGSEVSMVFSGHTALANLLIPEHELRFYFNTTISSRWQKAKKELQEIRLARNKFMETIPELMVMEEMPVKRQAHVLVRGAYDILGEKVLPDAPANILPFPSNLQRDRSGLAKWLFDPKNPLTSRVTVNRYWQTYFGVGIQSNADNFGNQGGVPTNLELLDWLAIYFRESGWNIKELQKLIVLSATYQQSSKPSPEAIIKDPSNLLWSRGPAFRMSAEMIRDAALAASGLLHDSIGGPSVKPYQPAGLWAVNSMVYNQDSGLNLFRRSMYTFWKRTNPPPSMNTFDAPVRSSCIVQRQKTNTPLQSLVLLNDPQFIEASRVLCEKSISIKTSLQERITYCYRALTGFSPDSKELAILERQFDLHYVKFKKDPSKARGWLEAGTKKIGNQQDRIELAAGSVLVSTIMNSDAYLMKR